jgi:NADPH:quinone reductase-like Zn-dependent oxidoreductase
MAQIRVPHQMTAVVLDSYSGAEALRVEQRPVPAPGRNEVLVKVAASPINPSDLAFLEGQYGFKKPPPVVPGLEGSGTVVAVGAGLMGRYLLGKRVACLSQAKGDGVWAEYVVTASKNGALPLHQSVSLELGAMSVVNPLTAIAFLEIVKAGGHKAIVQTAAASALGQMVVRLGQTEGVQVINVVRRDTQVELLKQQGATVVLNSNEASFEQQLHDACRQYEPRLALDAVAGPMTLQLLEALPPHSRVTVYGGLSYEPAQASPGQLIFQNKAVNGFWLGPWLAKKNPIQILMMWRRAQRLLSTQLKSNIRARYPFHEAKKAVQEYQSQMTGGKVLLRPSQ